MNDITATGYTFEKVVTKMHQVSSMYETSSDIVLKSRQNLTQKDKKPPALTGL